MKVETDVPTTDGQLFDVLHRMFGWGDFDQIARNDRPWYRVRAEEVAKIKRSRTRRRLTVQQLYETACWCHEQGIYPRTLKGLNMYLLPAEEAARERAREARRAEAEREVEAAIAREYEIGDERSAAWIERLVRTSGSERDNTLSEWREARG